MPALKPPSQRRRDWVRLRGQRRASWGAFTDQLAVFRSPPSVSWNTAPSHPGSRLGYEDEPPPTALARAHRRAPRARTSLAKGTGTLRRTSGDVGSIRCDHNRPVEHRIGSQHDPDAPTPELRAESEDDRRGRDRRIITFVGYPENRRQASRRADDLGIGEMTKAEFERACRSLQ
jgi:hypothetical protein